MIYDFSFELFKSLLEVVFGKKIDEEDRSYNRKLIMKFLNFISSIISISSIRDNSPFGIALPLVYRQDNGLYSKISTD